MPRGTEAISANHECLDTEKSSYIDVHTEDDALETDEMEEEVEYEEVEVVEEIEIEEEVEVDEDEDEEEQTEDNSTSIVIADENDERCQIHLTKPEDDDEKRRQSHLLSLPPHGSQIYVGGIPNDITEDDLKNFCETVGEVTEARIMKEKDSSVNKGFAFVTFKTVDLACKAIEELHNANLKGKQIKCSTAQAKNRLFINNVPRHWGEDDLKKIVEEVGPGMTALQLVKDLKNSGSNRGFAFIDYYNNACADYSRQKMLHPKFKLGVNTPTVSWAEPKNADSPASSQVKAIYVKNLPESVTQEQLKQLFECHGNISKVVIPPKKSGQENRRIAFVHFSERSNALKALKISDKYELDGQILECSLAKPWSDQKSVSRLNLQMEGLLPSYPSLMGHGLLGSAYGAVGGGYGASNFPRPLVYGNVLAPPDMAMTPLVLPDGQIGYILQQPGLHSHLPSSLERSHRNGSRGGVRGDGGSSSRHSYDSMHNNRYRPY